jgi:nicotinamide riboside kinase
MKSNLSLKKIVVIGPESTGKSTLCGYLADYYKTLWCPEFAREYLLEKYKNSIGFIYNNEYEGKGQSFIILN